MDRTRFVSLGEVDLFIREIGPVGVTDETLVVIHGGPSWDHSYLLPGLTPVSRHRRVILFDLRGCGGSTRGLGSDRYQPELVVDDLCRLIHALGLGSVDLLGFSTGGQVAQLFVEAYPTLVRQLILASTTAYAEVDHYKDGWREYERRLQFELAPPAWADGRSGEAEEGLRETVAWAVAAAPTAIWDLDRLDEYLELLGQVSFSGDWWAPFREGRLHPWRPKDPEQVLRDFHGPVLILHGACDMVFPVQVAQRLHAAVPGALLRVIDRAGHMAHFDRPEAWSSAVLDFLGV